MDLCVKCDGCVIEEIGQYYFKVDLLVIVIDFECVQYWFGVGVQLIEVVVVLLKCIGDWQKFIGDILLFGVKLQFECFNKDDLFNVVLVEVDEVLCEVIIKKFEGVVVDEVFELVVGDNSGEKVEV